MNTIADYISKKDEIDRLNKQIDMIDAFHEDKYKRLIKQSYDAKSALEHVRIENVFLKNQLKKEKKINDGWRLKCHNLKKESEPRKNRARGILLLKRRGLSKRTFKSIAYECFLSIYRIKMLWNEI